MKIESKKIAAVSLLMAGFAWNIGPASAQSIAPPCATTNGPMSIMVPFVVAKVRPAKQPYALIVEAPPVRGAAETTVPVPIFPVR